MPYKTTLFAAAQVADMLHLTYSASAAGYCVGDFDFTPEGLLRVETPDGTAYFAEQPIELTEVATATPVDTGGARWPMRFTVERGITPDDFKD